MCGNKCVVIGRGRGESGKGRLEFETKEKLKKKNLITRMMNFDFVGVNKCLVNCSGEVVLEGGREEE